MDVTEIIDDYIHDNRLTTAKTITNDSNYPFLGTIQVCVHYTSNPIFPGPVIGQNEFVSMMSQWRREEISWERNISKEQKSIAKGIFNTYLSHNFIYYLDIAGPDGIKKSVEEWEIDRDELILIMDTFLRNPDNVKLAKGAWKTAQTMLRKSYRDDEIGLNSYGSFNAFKDFNAFDVPLGDHLGKRGNKYAYYFDFQYQYINYGNTLNFKDLNSKGFVNSSDRVMAEYIDIKMEPEKVLAYDLDWSKTASTAIKITTSNIGVFNFDAKLPSCTSYFQFESDCLGKQASNHSQK